MCLLSSVQANLVFFADVFAAFPLPLKIFDKIENLPLSQTW